MNNNKPIKLRGAVFTPIWSGDRLPKTYDKFKEYSKIGEAWETASEATVIQSGGDILSFGEYLKEINAPVPPLVKLLDAASALSIQVHPNDASAQRLGGCAKSEIWYILAADEGTYITYGTKPGTDRTELKKAILSGDVERLLMRVPVKAGEVYMIPHGMIHSLGGGITVLEIQDQAGSTYRVKDICGNREIHPAEAAECAKVYSLKEASALATDDRSRLRDRSLPGDIIASTKGYAASLIASHGASEEFTVDFSGVHLFCVKGHGYAEDTEFTTGDSLYIPEGGCKLRLDAYTSVIFVI